MIYVFSLRPRPLQCEWSCRGFRVKGFKPSSDLLLALSEAIFSRRAVKSTRLDARMELQRTFIEMNQALAVAFPVRALQGLGFLGFRVCWLKVSMSSVISIAFRLDAVKWYG